MIKANYNFKQLSQNYLFAEIARRVAQYKGNNPEKHVISLGIGDVTRPLVPEVIKAMHKAVDDEANATTFHGYGPEQGYDFLRNKISDFDYKQHGIDIEPDEIFVSDGAKSDTGNIIDLFGDDNVIGLTDPVYPVYMDSNVMSGHAGKPFNGTHEHIVSLPCTEANGFAPEIPDRTLDLIYLCYPNNPTGTTLTKMQLTAWVNYALANGSLILFDAAYEAFITDDTPHSIYEIEGAKKCAIEFRSYSKTAGFTGVRLGYTVVPKDIIVKDNGTGELELNQMWRRRQTTKFNGASYISQRGAEAIYSPQGRAEVEAVSYHSSRQSAPRGIDISPCTPVTVVHKSVKRSLASHHGYVAIASCGCGVVSAVKVIAVFISAVGREPRGIDLQSRFVRQFLLPKQFGRKSSE